jgi:hypothetical protein
MTDATPTPELIAFRLPRSNRLGLSCKRRIKHLQYWADGRCIAAALSDGCDENFLQPRKISKFGLDVRQMRAGDALDFRARLLTGNGEFQQRPDVVDTEAEFAGAPHECQMPGVFTGIGTLAAGHARGLCDQPYSLVVAHSFKVDARRFGKLSDGDASRVRDHFCT